MPYQVYEAIHWHNSMNGDGPHKKHIGFFTDEKDAIALTVKASYTLSIVPPSPALTVFESIEEYDQHKQREFKKAALAKLSPAEREALGLADE